MRIASRAVIGRWWPPLKVGLMLLGFAVGLYFVFVVADPVAGDARAYYDADPVHPYALAHVGAGRLGEYLYSPAFSQALEPARLLPWEVFRPVYRCLQLAALGIMAGPLTLPALFVSPVAVEINAANIHLFLGLMIVAGFRWPAVWAFALLTKVTPGIGLLWFAARREWRHLAIALGATAAIVAVSTTLFGVGPWLDWLGVLAGNVGQPVPNTAIDVSLLPRLALATVIVTWGARTNHRWTVPLASMLALPVLWWVSGPAMLVAALPLLRWAPGTVTRDIPSDQADLHALPAAIPAEGARGGHDAR